MLAASWLAVAVVCTVSAQTAGKAKTISPAVNPNRQKIFIIT
jgi:hypothetical protein